MQARAVDDPAAFLELVEPLVRRDPVGCSVLAVSASRAVADPGYADGALFFVVESSDGSLVAAAQHVPPYRVGLHGIADAVAEAVAPAVLDLVLAERRRLAGLSGPVAVCSAVARVWTDRTGERAEVTRRLVRHELGTLCAPGDVPGRARVVEEADAALLAAWLEAFEEDIAQRTSPGPVLAARLLRTGTAVLWQRDAAEASVALAAWSPPASGVSRVGPVYTPPPQRGRGYGSAVTAAATRAALAGGAERVCLYTDLANPTSNAIYSRLGYVPAGEEVEITFSDA